jgi:hypothetical protein
MIGRKQKEIQQKIGWTERDTTKDWSADNGLQPLLFIFVFLFYS